MRPGEGKRKGENVAVAQCPASCGELIQGWILGSEKLVSCPVDWYSTVEVETGVPRKDERPLSRAMVDQLLAHWGYPAALSQQIRITLHSTIPVAKGMASSTADIAVTSSTIVAILLPDRTAIVRQTAQPRRMRRRDSRNLAKNTQPKMETLIAAVLAAKLRPAYSPAAASDALKRAMPSNWPGGPNPK